MSNTYNLLDNVGRRVEVDKPLVDPHLESVPSLRTLTTGAAESDVDLDMRRLKNSRLSGGVLEDLGGKPDGALDLEVTVLGPVDEVAADCRMSAGAYRRVGACKRTDTSQGA